TGKPINTVFQVIHTHSHTGTFELEYFVLDHISVFPFKLHSKFTFTGHHKISGTVLVAEGMTTHYNRLIPGSYQTGYIFHYDGFPENGSVEDVPDGTIG